MRRMYSSICDVLIRTLYKDSYSNFCTPTGVKTAKDYSLKDAGAETWFISLFVD